MKKLYINARFLLQRPTGVQRYAHEMCRAIIRSGADIVLICPEHGDVDDAYDISNFNLIRFGFGASHLWEQLILPFFFIRKTNYLLICFTGFGSIFIHNKIFTIHDLSFLVNPSWFSKSYYLSYKFLTPLAAKTSKKIITVSEFSKQEILRFYDNIPPDKVTVIYNAVDREKFSAGSCNKNDDETPYILAVSSLDSRKNFNRLIYAFRDLYNCRLKVVGGRNRIFNLEKGMESSSNIDYLGYVSDSELRKLYTNAAAFIYPSLYEGFGLPPLEAMSCRCPVLVSDIPVLREVCGEAAIYFNPLDIRSIRDAIQRILAIRPEERQRMIETGLKNIDRFSWNKSTETLLHTLTEL